MNPRFSLVLPCYNESETLPLLIKRYHEALAGRGDVEIIFVENGSSDNSLVLLREAESNPQFAWLKVTAVPVNQGYGYGILSGLSTARGEFIGWCHADSQYEPAQVVKVFETMGLSSSPHTTLVQGKRLGRPFFDRIFTAAMTQVAYLLLSLKVDDINAQPKLFPKTLLERFQNPPHDFSLDLFLLYIASRAGLTTMRLPVVFGKRRFGEAKGGAGSLKLKWKLTKRTFSFMRTLQRNIKDGVYGT